VTKAGDGWKTRCPAHNDKTPSLTITEGTDGRALLHCHRGCDIKQICAALGITEKELFPTDRRNGSARTTVATYPYHDVKGELLFEIVRYAPKDFRQRRPDGKGGWIWNMEGVKRVLYRLPKLVGDMEHGRPVFIVEGEKDADALVERGFCATTASGGAGKWQDSYSEVLRGADCIILPDKDERGREHADLVAGRLQGITKRLRVLELPDVNGKRVKDVYDFFAAGGDVGQLQDLVDAAPEWNGHANDHRLTVRTPDLLPPVIDAAEFLAQPIIPPPELIWGILHQGSKMVLGGGSKTFKTWTLTDLAVSVAAGEPWLSFKTTKGHVLFLNFEIQPAFFQHRIATVSKEKKIELSPGMIDVWNLRGHSASYHVIIPRIILDPIYKLYGDTDENAAGAVAKLLNALEWLTVDTGAAVAFGAHYSKGNQAAKEAIDRISGSGVFARDPDSILNFTQHEEPDAFVVEATLRNFKPVQPFVVRWQYPLMRRAEGLDPTKLKQQGGRPKLYTLDRLLPFLKGQKLNSQNWFKLASPETGISKTRFYALLEEARKHPNVKQTPSGQWFYEDTPAQ
jgi:5S rRNA maturation endonuclease (ribonuclease M5)